jgi:hypothetical protein
VIGVGRGADQHGIIQNLKEGLWWLATSQESWEAAAAVKLAALGGYVYNNWNRAREAIRDFGAAAENELFDGAHLEEFLNTALWEAEYDPAMAEAVEYISAFAL